MSRSSYSFLLILFFVFIFSSCVSKNDNTTKSSAVVSITYSAMDDFYAVKKEGYAPFYIDSVRSVLAIDAAVYKDDYAVAEVIFDGVNGNYSIVFTSMTEIDGESTYRLLVNGILINEFQNPESETDFDLIAHTIKSLELKNGDAIQIEFKPHSNGKIPEDGAFAYARGRWKSIEVIMLL